MAESKDNKKLVGKLLAIIAGMFAFAFALVPLYNVFCDITGINGKVRNKALYQKIKTDDKRTVRVEFLTHNMRGMPWQFKALQPVVEVHPGELKEVRFFVHNPTHRTIVGKSVPSISPNEASLYIHKTECFCFEQQTLAAGESEEMPMRFYLDPDLPEDITQLTVSYQLFNISESALQASR